MKFVHMNWRSSWLFGAYIGHETRIEKDHARKVLMLRLFFTTHTWEIQFGRRKVGL